MATQLEKIFLAYASNSIRKNPQVFYDIVKKYNALGFVDLNHEINCPPEPDFGRRSAVSILNMLIDYFLVMVKCNDLKTATEMLKAKKKIKDKKPFDYRCWRAAYRAVYFFAEGCVKDRACFYNYRTRYLGVELFTGPNRIKCYECDQLFFRYMLKNIINGKEYSEIGAGELELLILTTQSIFAPDIMVTKASSKSPFREKLTKRIRYHPPYWSFRQTFLKRFVAHSLAEFLVHNDRRTLKHCPECNNFHIAKRLTKKFCSDKCRMAWNNRKRIESGEHAKYKRERKEAGKATVSYYG